MPLSINQQKYQFYSLCLFLVYSASYYTNFCKNFYFINGVLGLGCDGVTDGARDYRDYGLGVRISSNRNSTVLLKLCIGFGTWEGSLQKGILQSCMDGLYRRQKEP